MYKGVKKSFLYLPCATYSLVTVVGHPRNGAKGEKAYGLN